VAVAAGQEILASADLGRERDYASTLVPTADRLCRQVGWRPQEIEQVYVSIGPGSFTGTRIGVTFAKTVALAAGAKVVAVPTMDAVAANLVRLSGPPENLLVLLDARRARVFAALYRWAGGRYEKVEPEQLVGLQEVVESVFGRTRPLAVVGEAAGLYRQQIEDAGLQVLAEQFWMPTVRGVHAVGWQMAQAGQFCDADKLTPRYIRLPSPVEKLQARKDSPPRK